MKRWRSKGERDGKYLLKADCTFVKDFLRFENARASNSFFVHLSKLWRKEETSLSEFVSKFCFNYFLIKHYHSRF